MTERETIDYIQSIQKLGSHLGLESVRELCKRLGNPQDALKFIHIAGTNGKGSVLAMISETLAKSGYKTGRYLSPTISDYRERFQINGRMIGKKTLSGYVERLKGVCEEMTEAGFSHPTPFEFETALAFLYFKEKACDVVVVETGMGGRTDATNIITTTMIAVLTSVSMDHMQFLGNNLAAITDVKAGIIKEGIHVVSAWQKPEAEQVIRQRCTQKMPFCIWQMKRKQSFGGEQETEFLFPTGSMEKFFFPCGALISLSMQRQRWKHWTVLEITSVSGFRRKK